MVSATVVLGATVATVFAVTAVGALAARGRVGNVEDFITARNTTGAGSLTATLVASSMGAWILFSPAEAGAAFGGLAAVAGYAAGSAVPMIAYAWLGPRIRRLIPRGHSLTEYAYARYGTAMYAYVLAVSVAYMFTFLAAEMTGITGALSLIAGVPRWQTAAVVGAAVLAYTAYGGLRASIVTDVVQTLVVLPLLAVAFGAALLSLGGTGAVYDRIVAADPSLLDPGFLGGLEFGAYVVIAVLGAEMLNQAWWQRVYTAESEATLRRSFLVAAVAVVPMVLLAGLFGPVARGLGLDLSGGRASVAFFVVVTETMPDAVVLAVAVLAVLLVTSSADTLLNAIASVVTADLPRLVDADDLTGAARLLTVAVALAAIAVGAQGYSVLAVFLTADLLASATFIPLLAGLFSPRVRGRAALVASVAGLVAGVAFFPIARPVLVPTVAGALPASFLYAFFGAAAVSGGVTLAAVLLAPGEYDLGRLEREIGRLDGAADGGPAGTGPDTAEVSRTADGGPDRGAVGDGGGGGGDRR